MLKFSKIWDALTDYKAIFFQVNNMVNDQLRSQHGNLQRIFENSGSERQADARVQNTSGSDNLFGDMFNSMHQSMQEMMKGFMGAASSGQDHTQERNEDGKIVHGGGELVVIKSGSTTLHKIYVYRKMPNTVEVVALT